MQQWDLARMSKAVATQHFDEALDHNDTDVQPGYSDQAKSDADRLLYKQWHSVEDAEEARRRLHMNLLGVPKTGGADTGSSTSVMSPDSDVTGVGGESTPASADVSELGGEETDSNSQTIENTLVDDDGLAVENTETGPLADVEIKRVKQIEAKVTSLEMRPFRYHDVGKRVVMSNDERRFLDVVKNKGYTLKFDDYNFKKPGTETHRRYEQYKAATTYQEAIDMGAVPGDITWAMERGRLYFPGRENLHDGHFVSAVYCAVEGDTQSLTQHFACVATANNQNSTVDSQSFHDQIINLWAKDDIPEYAESHEQLKQFAMAEAYNFFCLGTPSELPSQYKDALADNPSQSVDPDASYAMMARSWSECAKAEGQDVQAFQKESGLPSSEEALASGTPKNYSKAVASPYSQVWLKSMAKEWGDLEKLPAFKYITWEQARQNPAFNPKQVMRVMWVYRWKTNESGEVYKAKSRAVVMGNFAVKGIHYNETFAPTQDISTLRCSMAIAAAKGFTTTQLDVSQAFVQASIPPEKPIWIHPAEGFDRYYTDPSGRKSKMILQLERNLYGMPDAPLMWYKVFSDFLVKELGFTRMTSDQCMFTLSRGKSQVHLSVYVDDVLILDNDAELRKEILQKLSKRFPVNENETGDASWLLGINITKDKVAGTIKLSQEAAIDTLVDRCNLDYSNPSRIPMTDLLPKLEKAEVDPETCIGGKSFRSVLGSCLYLSMVTRPDISFAVNHLARHAITPGKAHAKALTKVVQYLKGTRSKGLVYGKQPKDQENRLQFYEAGAFPKDLGAEGLTSYADADYAASYTRRSTSGFVVFLNGAPISWGSRLQKICAQSTAEAEIVAATDCVKEVIHARLMMQEFGFEDVQSGPTTVYEDNRAAQLMCMNEKSSKGAKHFEVRLRFLQDHCAQQTVQFKQIGTDDQIADVFTKPLAADKFQKFASTLVT